MATERMSRVDTSWLRMDSDVNLMVIVGVWMLEPKVSLDAVRRRCAERLARYGRFHQKVVVDALGASWVDDDAFDIAHHVQAVKLERRRGQSRRAALQALCGRLAATPFDAERPLWQFLLVEDYEGGSALVARIHHCIADGMALISVMLGLTDDDKGRARRRKRTAQAQAHDAQARRGPADGAADWLRKGSKIVQDVAALALLSDDSPTRLKGKGSGKKVVAWTDPLPLDAVKVVGKALGCTINDVLLSCAAGAIGSWLRDQGDDPQGQEIRAMVPVDLRASEDAGTLGNRFGLAPLVLPIGIANPLDRLYAVRRRMADMKGSYQPLLAFGILTLTGLFVKPMQDAVLGMFVKKATAVMTNVPGPREPLKLCGSTLRRIVFWVPATGDIGVHLSILSYAGGVQMALMTDEALCARPGEIIERFEPEFRRLRPVAMALAGPGRKS
ncbi:MAG TPA: wax ester/triacylglycerol synthase family O-acyltransferase [Rubrivivax sp.]|nr:wax ester/triacylglycerol synthase family O-acyltransferase [Rubrivivax sp.]HPP83112.1 wax ester/triacylglycerol synthase family O-acyltransferase [Rubrivivax sp.]